MYSLFSMQYTMTGRIEAVHLENGIDKRKGIRLALGLLHLV
jgi:hypothetical protein